MTGTQLFTNNAIAILQVSIDDTTATQIVLQPGQGEYYPQPVNLGDFFLVTLETINAPLYREIIAISGRSGDILTIAPNGRAQENESGLFPARAWVTGQTLVDHRITANTITEAFLNPPSSGSGSLQLYAENPQLGVSSPVALGNNAVGIGEQAIGAADDSLAIGKQALTRIAGSVVQANGRFSSSGDAQAGRYILRANTVSNAPSEGFMDGQGGSIRLVLPDNATWTFRILVTAQRTDVSDGRAGYEFKGVIYRIAGAESVSIQGQITGEQIASNNQNWNVLVDADTINGSLRIQFVGELAKLIRWVALIETVEVTD